MVWYLITICYLTIPHHQRSLITCAILTSITMLNEPPNTQSAPRSCIQCRNAKQRAAPHHRTAHKYPQLNQYRQPFHVHLNKMAQGLSKPIL